MDDLTYAFEGDRAYAIREGKVVAAADSIEQLEQKLACSCGHGCEDGCDGCPQCKEATKESATHIVTPNGLRGHILGKVRGTWGDVVTVRFENGRIVQLPVTDGLTFQAAQQEKVASVSPIESLRTRLAASTNGSQEELQARAQELAAIEHEARTLIAASTDYNVSEELDSIVSEARYEAREVHAALEHLADATPYAPPAQYEMRAVEHGGNRPDSGWLQNTMDQMISEAEATDYDKLMNEGPEEFVAELPDAAVADQGVTQNMALSFVKSKTAGTDPEVKEDFERKFIARVETLRRAELANRKQQAAEKTASVQEPEGATDEGLFL